MNFNLQNLPDAFYLDPYPTYRALRESHPVYRFNDGSYFLSRHSDALRVYRATESFSSDKTIEFGEKFGSCPLYEHHTTSLVFNDPPLHSTVRKRIAATLKPTAVSAMNTTIESLVDRLLNQIKPGEAFDGITDFAAQIPVEVIGNLLGVPHEHRAPLRHWSLAILGALEASVTSDALAAGNQAVREFSSYLHELIEDRHAAIEQHNAGDDILTRLIQPMNNAKPLTREQLIHNAIFILNAGHETTTNLIGNSIDTLLDNESSRHRLIDEPAIMETAVDEFLRFESPNQLGNRVCTQDVEVGEDVLAKGSRVWIGIGAANRDPEAFDHPDRLQLDRQPNRHVAFAAGIHTCIGLNVARLEATIALRRLFTRFPGLTRASPAKRAHRARFRGFTSLPLVAKPA